ncbi:MAG TPA: metallophosphoesterase family protein, partial [Armatimonadota bacterium]|nr:metallophosphoesterase family protein [Armatimonadota bacterium]
MRTFVIGDIHGHLRQLRGLLSQVRWEAAPGDALVFVGDYIDRGPDSRGVVDLVIDQVNGDWDGPVTPLKGNHEVLMLDFLAGSPLYEPDVWLSNGGEETIASYSGGGHPGHWQDEIPSRHHAFFRSLKSWHEDTNGIYVHAGIWPGMQPAESPEDDLLWIREPFIDSAYRWPKVVVFGHTPQFDPAGPRPAVRTQLPWRPLDRPEKIGIDTGAA